MKRAIILLLLVAVPASAQKTQKPPLHGSHWMAITGKPLGAAGANETKIGWYKVEDGVAVRITDDGKAHRIQAR